MKIGKYILGFILILAAWFAPIDWTWKVLLFIIGYDVFPFIGKIGLVILVLFGSSLPLVSQLTGISVLLVVLLIVDIITMFIPLGFLAGIIKTIIVFIAAWIALGNPLFAVIAAGIDFAVQHFF
jgi:hypothetical protein